MKEKPDRKIVSLGGFWYEEKGGDLISTSFAVRNTFFIKIKNVLPAYVISWGEEFRISMLIYWIVHIIFLFYFGKKVNIRHLIIIISAMIVLFIQNVIKVHELSLEKDTVSFTRLLIVYMYNLIFENIISFLTFLSIFSDMNTPLRMSEK